jgi:hypothetical protein
VADGAATYAECQAQPEVLRSSCASKACVLSRGSSRSVCQFPSRAPTQASYALSAIIWNLW